MFASNERISVRQFHRLLTLELFGVTTVLLPKVLCERVRQDGIPALLLGLLFVCIYGWFLSSVAKSAGRSLQQTLKGIHVVTYDLFLFVMVIQMLLMGIWVLSMAGELIRDILMKDSELGFVIVTFAIICLIGAWKGMECRGRMAEVLYLFLLVPFLLLLLLAAGKMEADSIEPLFVQPAETVLSGSYEVFIVFQGVTLGFFALPYLKNQKHFWSGIRRSVLWNGCFCVLLLIVAIGIFGLSGAASQKWLAVNLMTTPDFPGGFVERLDVLMVTIWIVSLFFFISGAMFYSGKMANRLLRLKRNGSGMLLMALLMTGGSVIFKSAAFSYNIYLNYMKYIGVPLLLLMFVLVKCKVRPSGMVSAGMVVLLAAACLSGCSRGVELEDRKFALALGVDCVGDGMEFYYDTSELANGGEKGEPDIVSAQAAQISDLLPAYGRQSDKYLDCNHVKALIIGKNLAQNQEKMTEFLAYMQKQEMFASNVKVFLAKDMLEDVFVPDSQPDAVLGEYLENLYVDSNYYVENQSTSMGDLLKHWHDYDETLLIPILERTDESLEIADYGIMQQVRWVDTLEEADAELVFLANGVNVLMEMQLDGCMVRTEHVTRDVTFTDDVTPQAVVTLHMRGQAVNRELQEKEKRRLEKKWNENLEERYNRGTDDNEYDLLHLFRALGRRDREMWLKYRTQREWFNRNLGVMIQVKMQIM